jgi:hypothetical protein
MPLAAHRPRVVVAAVGARAVELAGSRRRMKIEDEVSQNLKSKSLTLMSLISIQGHMPAMRAGAVGGARARAAMACNT